MTNDVVRWTGNSRNRPRPFRSSHCDSPLVNSANNNRSKKILNHSISCTTTIATLATPRRDFFTVVFLMFLQLNVLLSCSSMVAAAQFDVLNNELAYDDVVVASRGHYTPTWAVHIPDGDSGLADQVASEHGFVNVGKIFDDHYHFVHHKVAKRSLTPSHHHQKRLSDDDRVHWFEQQKAKSRQKRDFIRMRPSRTSSRAKSLVDSMGLDDPKWPQMWYLNRGNGLDMNVIPAWKSGITGKGVVVTILDDGLESDHPDIEKNYDPKASYDVNSHDDDPMPHYDMTDSNRHGTRCAGEVAATENNTICAVGIAYGASVGGVRMLDGDVTDAVEARSLSLNPQHIDIYSASWGPDDDGKTVDGPGELASRAFIEGVTKGRSGKGSIFIWASGNGGREMDNCNCDGYTNSIWTLSISSATEEGHVPWYSEKCSSTLATTYSSGGQSEKQVVTTDLHHSCTVSHSGTSASAPLAAGIAALALEANRNLTWRDLQHIVVRTAKPANLQDQSWYNNGVGRRVSHSFGYGLMDAHAMVKLAKIWRTVPEQQRCEINAPHVDKTIPPKSYISLQLTAKHCSSVNFLEHVQAKITLTSQRRGDLQIYLKSPAGTKVTLLTSRVHDVSRSGFNQWPFMSVHTWGESPHGNWHLEIHNEGRYMVPALLREWSLILYGTAHAIDPSDPVSVMPAPSSNATMTSSSSSTNLHQVYSPQYPRLPPSSQNSLPKPNPKFHSILFPNATTPVRGKHPQTPPPYHQVSATYGVILGSAKGKAKNSKNNNSSGGKNGAKGGGGGGQNSPKGGGGGNGGRQKGESKPNFYRITGLSKPTQRPKAAAANGANSGKPSKAEKMAAKAPKQVKDNNLLAGDISQSLEEESVERVVSQTNPRIPKLFEQYEKIQQIFPEFHPYTVPKDVAAKQQNANRKPPGPGTTRAPSTNAKPSRENSKKLSSSQSQGHQPPTSSAAASDAQQDNKIKDRIYIPNRKSTNAQITQWDLIFYGTETPAQPEDPVHISPDGQFGSYGSDMEHNLLEYDSDSASGQWRNMQQIGESQADVQRTNDRTSTACVQLTLDQKCIECAFPTYLYKSRCYLECPIRSYPLREKLKDREDIVRFRNEPDDALFLNRDTRQKRFYSPPQKLCAQCDKSCLTCVGANPSDCTTCFPGSQLRILAVNESYCYGFAERSSGNSKDTIVEDTKGDLKNGIAFILIIVPSIVLVLLIAMLLIFRNKVELPFRGSQRYTYDRVALDISHEEALVLPENEAEPAGAGEPVASCSGLAQQRTYAALEGSSDSDDSYSDEKTY